MHNWDLEPKPPSILLNYHIPWLMDVEPAFKQIDELRRDLTHAYLTAKPCADFEPIKHLGRLPGLWVLEDDNLYAWADLLVIHAGKYTPKVGVALESINEHIANCETCGLQVRLRNSSTCSPVSGVTQLSVHGRMTDSQAFPHTNFELFNQGLIRYQSNLI
eukprot:TRINITY_DN11404_c0_g1_i5.p1 TRINITY_DN11404_c0_g1~~TRINITY_DN11404_c0_g1_i5.p1  ORF type:complete len:161 (+),score=23.28 TRINITY_DN11404_c0_g1_i5:137-619(+)